MQYCAGFGLPWWGWGLMGLGAITILFLAALGYQLVYEQIDFARKTRRGLVGDAG